MTINRKMRIVEARIEENFNKYGRCDNLLNVFTSTQIHNSKKISIYAPEFPFIGHSITNLAKFQAAYVKSKYSQRLENNLINETYYEQEINFYHIGNSPHNLEVLDNFMKSRSAKNILILHDTNLTDLIKFAVKNNGLKNVKELFKNQSPRLIKRVLHEITTLDDPTKCSFFIDSIFKMNLRNTKIVIHNSQNLKSFDDLKHDNLSLIELPIGYHYMKPLVPNLSQPIPLIVVGGSHRDSNFSEDMKIMFQELSSKIEFRAIFLGGIAKHSLGSLIELPNISILENVSNENWQIILSRADISIRVGVGRNGESSGFLRDSVLRSKCVLGDEGSLELKNFSNYKLLNQNADIKQMSPLILEILENDYPIDTDQISRNNLEIEQKSLMKYFEYLNDLGSNS